MTETNQKKLYKHFKKVVDSGATEQIRKMAERNVAMTLKAYPHFAEEIPEEKPKSKDKK